MFFIPSYLQSNLKLDTNSLEEQQEDNSENEVEDEGEIRCICGFAEDDGYTIQCEKCFVWQHVACVVTNQNDVPDHYLCENCSPRWLNVEV